MTKQDATLGVVERERTGGPQPICCPHCHQPTGLFWQSETIAMRPVSVSVSWVETPVVDNPDGQGHGETDDQRRHREAIDAATKGAVGL